MGSFRCASVVGLAGWHLLLDWFGGEHLLGEAKIGVGLVGWHRWWWGGG